MTATGDIEGMAAKDKGELMKESRARKLTDQDLVRKEVWVHKDRTLDEVKAAVKKLRKPPNKA